MDQFEKNLKSPWRGELSKWVDFMPGCIYWKDLRGRYMGCNTAFLAALDLQRKDIVGKIDEEVWSCPQELSVIRCHDAAVMAADRTWYFEETLTAARTKHFAVAKMPLWDKGDHVVGIMGFLIDITCYKHADNQQKDHLHILMDTVPGSLYWKNQAGVYLGCNDFMVKVTGQSDKAAVIGKKDRALWPKQAKALRKNDLKVMKSGQPVYLEECIDLPAGQRYFSVVKIPWRDSRGRIIGIIGNSMDITQLKQYQIRLEEEKEKAERACQVKQAFLYNMRHDIRTPFAGLLGLAEYLEAAEKDSEKKALLGYLTQSAHALLGIMNEILDHLERDTTALGLLIKPFSPKALISTLDKALLSAVHQKGLDWRVRYDARIPTVLYGDKLALYRLLMNLLCNAVKFTDKGGVNLTVDMAYREQKRVFLRFIVQDTGSGIPEDKVDFIFEQFTCATPAYTGRHAGIGLGLRCVKQFIDAVEDAEIEVNSQLNQGSIFTCTIPFKIPLSARLTPA